MKIVIEIFVSAFIIIITAALCIGFISSDLVVMDARDSFQSYANELQESDFSDAVIQGCTQDAAANGYGLTVKTYTTSAGDRTAEVTLTYSYRVFAVGVEQDKTISAYLN